MKEAINELSNPDFAAAITRFVKNYGRDVSSTEDGRSSVDMGASEQVARPCQCCAVPHGEFTYRRGGFKGVV